jgi:hypothetical protein
VKFLLLLSILIITNIIYANKKRDKQLFCLVVHNKLNVKLNNSEYNYKVIETVKIHVAEYWITDISVLKQNLPSFPQYVCELSGN